MTSYVSVQQTRGSGLGASDVAGAIGLSQWERPIDVWKRLTGRLPPKTETAGMRIGKAVEPAVRSLYVEDTGFTVIVPAAAIAHHILPWLSATPDGIALRNGDDPFSHLVEVKVPSFYAAHLWGDDRQRIVPLYYQVQGRVQMACTNLPRVDFAVLIGHDFFIVPVERDLEAEALILEKAAEFWRYVETDTEPLFDGSEEHVRHLVSKLDRNGQLIQASPEVEDKAKRWRRIERLSKKLEAHRNKVKGEIAEFMVETGASRIQTSHGRLYVQPGGQTYDDFAMAQDFANRLQLLGVDVDIEKERQRFARKQSAPALRRPNNWTTEDK